MSGAVSVSGTASVLGAARPDDRGSAPGGGRTLARHDAAGLPVAERPLQIAMFAPLPPLPSGIAAYVLDLLPLLPAPWRLDLFGDTDVEADAGRLDAARTGVACFPHTEFAARQAAEPYDLTIYQVGNSTERTWMFPYVVEHPGLLVLHDGVLHPARVEDATRRVDMAGYRRIAESCRPEAGAALGHLVAGGLGGPALYTTFPLCEDLVRASRATGMHGELLCGWLRAMVPDARVMPLAHWRSVGRDPHPPSVAVRGECGVVEARDRGTPARGGPQDAWEERGTVGTVGRNNGTAGARERWRSELARPGEVLIGSFGNIGRERRLEQLLNALAGIETANRWRLIVAGSVDPRLRLREQAAGLGIADRITWRAGLPDTDFVAAMAAVDLAVNLRFPPARASSGVLHQLLQLGVPVVITDVLHWRDYPAAAVARVPPGPDDAEAAALRAALARWIDDPEASAAAGRAAAGWARAHITPERMRDSYVAAAQAALESGGLA
jgi:glycosyltransferase involved in cell wall biosynthesis